MFRNENGGANLVRTYGYLTILTWGAVAASPAAMNGMVFHYSFWTCAVRMQNVFVPVYA